MTRQNLIDSHVKLRLRWIEHYKQITKNVSSTCRYFGICRTSFYIWYHRYMSLGVEGLKPKSSRPHKIHRWLPKGCPGNNHCFAAKASLWPETSGILLEAAIELVYLIKNHLAVV